MGSNNEKFVIENDVPEGKGHLIRDLRHLEQQVKSTGHLTDLAITEYMEIGKQGVPEAFEWLGEYYVRGEYVDRDLTRALELQKRSIKEGNGLAYQAFALTFLYRYFEEDYDPRDLDHVQQACDALFSYADKRKELWTAYRKHIAGHLAEALVLTLIIDRPPAVREVFSELYLDVRCVLTHKLEGDGPSDIAEYSKAAIRWLDSELLK